MAFPQQNSQVDYRAHDQYLSSGTYVLGQEGGESIDLHPGTYSYNFQVALSPQLPSSLEGKYGHICYQVVVTIDRPWRFNDVFKKPFTVLYSLDLNQNFTYKAPIYLEVETIFCCMCRLSGLLAAKLSVPF
ncbi:arrestin domain-containing protein 2-like [Hermetia illucens]|uniref:arrestin domain-containing protein 2-like n=1 Tax=Hermetia illucens TaxID=343691 RepID=UPI0018CBF559|nr:arrestin domain-containing protein 2-like [Hermetia illucens]